MVLVVENLLVNTGDIRDEKTLLLGKIEGGRRRGRQRMRWLDGITDSMDMSSMDREAWHAAVHGVTKSQTSTSFECPASCIKLALVICFTYGSIHVSMLFSQIIPPSPSPTESRWNG